MEEKSVFVLASVFELSRKLWRNMSVLFLSRFLHFQQTYETCLWQNHVENCESDFVVSWERHSDSFNSKQLHSYLKFDCKLCALRSGALWWDPFHSSQPDRLLEVHTEHIRPAGRLPLQPRVHGHPWSAHQCADLSACWWRSHRHAVYSQLHLVRCDASYISRRIKSVTCSKCSFWSQLN